MAHQGYIMLAALEAWAAVSWKSGQLGSLAGTHLWPTFLCPFPFQFDVKLATTMMGYDVKHDSCMLVLLFFFFFFLLLSIENN